MQTRDIIVISGPSGAGKTTLLTQLFKRNFIRNNFLKSISVTTRAKRPGEKDRKDYYFIDDTRYHALAKQKKFLETQRVLDHYYATPKTYYVDALRTKKNLIVCIDVKGALYLKKHFKRGSIISIFITVAAFRDLHTRLNARADEKKIIKKKIALAKKELRYAQFYDYVIVNQELDTSVKILGAILLAEKYRR